MMLRSSGLLAEAGLYPSPCPSPTRGEGTLGLVISPLKSPRVFQLAKSHQPRPLPPCGGGTGRGVSHAKGERSIQT